MKDLKIFTNNIEDKALGQINLLLEQTPFKDCKVRIMPDVHAGAGCVIGFTGNLGDKIIPNIVGVDIGCGMLTIELGNVDLDLSYLDEIINKYIPSGFNVYDNKVFDFKQLKDLKCLNELKSINRLENSIGTLGGGNHFIEVDVDTEGNKYLIIHTGSRNLGKQVAEIYQDIAINHCLGGMPTKKERELIIKTLREQGRENEIEYELNKIKKGFIDIPKDLCFLENEDRSNYLHDMKICQEFASTNRLIIAVTILQKLFDLSNNYSVINNKIIFDTNYEFNTFETIHNYIDLDSNIVRKGAISAKRDEIVLIPINMRDGCIIAQGLGNSDWNYSAPHGAGRIMSRMKAIETLNLDSFKESMKGIYTTSVNETTIDEAPFAYKPMQEIIDNIKDTVTILKIIKPIYNFKASEIPDYKKKYK